MLDLSLEYYFNGHNALTGAVFYRDVDGYIQSTITPQTIGGIVYQVTEPTNAPAGKIEGAEVGYTQFFDFLPGLWSGLGVQANATYVRRRVPEHLEMVVQPHRHLREGPGVLPRRVQLAIGI